MQNIFLIKLTTLKQLAIALMCNVATFSYGLHIGWLSPLQPALQSLDSPIGGPPLTDEEVSWIGSLPSIANVISAPVFGYIMDKFGRKIALMLTTLPNIISFALLLSANDVNIVYIARVIGGFCTCGAFIVGPIYVSETVSPKWKGTFGGLSGFFAKFGIILGYIFGSYTSYTILNLVCGSFTVLFLLFSPWLPESPVYLIKNGKVPEAETVFRNLWGEVKKTEEISPDVNFKKLFTDYRQRKAFIIISTMFAIQMFTGYPAVIRYAVDIFNRAGTSYSSHVASIFLAVSQLLFSFLGAILIDKIGRKTLIILSLVGIGLTMAVLSLQLKIELPGLKYLPSFLLVAFVGSYAFGFGTVPFVLTPELFGPESRASAASIGIMWCAFCEFIVVKLFPTFNNIIGLAGSLGVFAGVGFFGAVFLGVVMFETKDLDFDAIQVKLGRKIFGGSRKEENSVV